MCVVRQATAGGRLKPDPIIYIHVIVMLNLHLITKKPRSQQQVLRLISVLDDLRGGQHPLKDVWLTWQARDLSVLHLILQYSVVPRPTCTLHI